MYIVDFEELDATRSDYSYSIYTSYGSDGDIWSLCNYTQQEKRALKIKMLNTYRKVKIKIHYDLVGVDNCFPKALSQNNGFQTNA